MMLDEFLDGANQPRSRKGHRDTILMVVQRKVFMPDGGIPVYVRDGLTHVYDYARSPSATGWAAGNEMASRLLRCLEAVRDLGLQLDALLRCAPEERTARLTKSLAVPLLTLYELLSRLLNTLENDKSERKKLTAENKDAVRNCLAAFDKIGLVQRGDLKLVRDKIGAHIDDDASAIASIRIWQKVDLRRFMDWGIVMLAAMSQVLVMDIFAWSEMGTHEDVWQLMSCDGTVVHFRRVKDSPSCDGEFPWEISAIELAHSPKIAISNELLAAREKCFALLGFFPRNDDSGTTA